MIAGIRVIFLIFGAFPTFLSPTRSQELPQECGKLRETQLHNEMEITAPNESPVFILFGDWRANENFKVGDCRLEKDSTTCTPPPQAVDMEHISVDPQYKVGEHDYDIALAKMVRDVELSEFVQPLCLPPAREIEGNHISRRLEMAGFVLEHSFNGERTLDVQWRRKVVRHTTSLEFCISLAEALEKLTLSQNHLCGVEIKPNNLMSGSPLMDVEVVDGKPRNFYLVGINTFETESDSASPIYIDGFMRILPFRNWILENIEYAMH